MNDRGIPCKTLRMLREEYQASLQKHAPPRPHLTAHQAKVLVAIRKAGGVTVMELADLLGSGRSGVYAILQTLESKGVIEKREGTGVAGCNTVPAVYVARG